MSEALRQFEQDIFGGHDAGELHIADHGDGPCATMYLMDAEYDPIRVTFSGDGDAMFDAIQYDWVSLTKSQLRFVASKCDQGAKMTRSCYSDDGEIICEQNKTKP